MIKMKKKNLGNILLPLTLCIGIIGGVFIGRYSQKENLSGEEEKFLGILGLIKEQYVDNVDTDSLLEASYSRLLASLDPHSAYIPKSDFTAVNDELEGAFSGVGVSFQIINDTVMVVEVVPGGPAEKVGILAGDRIISANDKSLTGDTISNEDVFKTLRGEEGSEVALKIKRDSSRKTLDYTVIRGEIPVNSVDSKYMISENIGYLRVTKFARNTHNEFYNALIELRKSGAQKFIIDLRGNAGGFLDQAIFMANEFLPAGKMIVYTKGRTPENEMMAMSDGSGTFQDSEVVVLTNEFSASASEIFAGAIQDNDRGLVIGRRTFGKGLVQNQSMLPDSSAIRLTVARYYTPSGRSIQKEYQRGVTDKYELDILDRYSHGEFYSADSIKLDKSKLFFTMGGRKVYGGGGIMPDIFVPEDTTGITQYYMEALNRGLIQKYSYKVAEIYRKMLKEKTLEELLRILPRDNTLLNNFVSYAAENGLPAQWYYIRKSRDLLINQLKAVIARDILGYNEFLQVLNLEDITVKKAVMELMNGHSPVVIENKEEGKPVSQFFEGAEFLKIYLDLPERRKNNMNVLTENKLNQKIKYYGKK